MSLFKKLFARPGARKPASEAETPESASLIVLLGRLPASLDALAQAFPQRLPALGPLHLDRETPDDPAFPAMLEAGGHHVWALGFDLPVPEGVQQTSIFYSNWGDDQKAAMYGHAAHVLLFYRGGSDDPLVQLSVLYALAASFRPLGVADEAAFNCVPGALMEDLFNAEFFQEAQTNIPSLLWTGFQKFHREDGQIWYASRGFQRFGKPNLAFLAPAGYAEQATGLFHALLNYQHFSGQTFAAGHTAELGGQFLRFAAPHEYAEYLSGGHPVLTVSTQR